MRVSDAEKAIKHDQDKPPMYLLPYPALVEIAHGMGHGEQKYGRYNYRHGMEWVRYYAAAMRHLGAWSEGEDLDPETALNHIAHAACNCLMLLQNIKDGVGTDDRFSKRVNQITPRDSNCAAHAHVEEPDYGTAGAATPQDYRAERSDAAHTEQNYRGTSDK